MNRYSRVWNPYAGLGAAQWTDYAPPASWAGLGAGPGPVYRPLRWDGYGANPGAVYGMGLGMTALWGGVVFLAARYGKRWPPAIRWTRWPLMLYGSWQAFNWASGTLQVGAIATAQNALAPAPAPAPGGAPVEPLPFLEPTIV